MSLTFTTENHPTFKISGFEMRTYWDHKIDLTSNYIQQGEPNDVVLLIGNTTTKEKQQEKEETKKLLSPNEVIYSLYFQSTEKKYQIKEGFEIEYDQVLIQIENEKPIYRSKNVKGTLKIVKKPRSFWDKLCDVVQLCKQSPTQYEIECDLIASEPEKDFRGYYFDGYEKKEKNPPISIVGKVPFKNID
ncbi:hypothetical protein M0812_12865 [Anaeramoeba flamelloides]|uniref:Uncharacterized protein n=1 Tax=Anaeramoeba flamelloides TaxID=1746091 RepID=A0AAV7ZKJ8_9EUKA|nr:hypothetical protein M0812_12865 [Anaeramoeba flamelloides]